MTGPAPHTRDKEGLVAPVPPHSMMRAIGRWSLVALVVNLTIGAGIFGLPSAAASILGSQSPAAYLIAAAGIGVIAACGAEVASRFQETGTSPKAPARCRPY